MAEHQEPLRATPDHPGEMSAHVHLRVGGMSLRASAHATPAGLLAVGVLVSAIILSVAPLVWAARRRPA